MQAVVGKLPPDGHWRIGHFGVLATVTALTVGRPWLDALLATLGLRRRQLSDLIAAQLPAVSWHRKRPTWPGSTAGVSGRATSRASCS